MAESAKNIHDQFFAWLAEELPSDQASELYTILNVVCTNIETFCTQKGVLKGSLFQTTDLNIVNSVLTLANSDDVSRIVAAEKVSKMHSVLCLYNKFLKEEFLKKDQTALSEELLGLLTDDDMELLRNKLLEQNILTLDQFKAVNPWEFMNIHNLYSIRERQSVYKRISEKLLAESTQESTQQYLLKTKLMSYSGTTPAETFSNFCEYMAQKHLQTLCTALDVKYHEQDEVMLSRENIWGNAIKIVNLNAYVDSQLTPEQVVVFARWICEICNEPDQPEEMLIPAGGGFSATLHAEAQPNPDKSPTMPPMKSRLVQQAEKVVLKADLDGITFDELSKVLTTTRTAVKDAVAVSKHIVLLNGKLYHDKAFVDWEDGADRLEHILDKLLDRNGGYVSAAQLYEYAQADMQMFLNDNDMDDPSMIYDMAQHLFEKTNYHGKHLSFQFKSHISLDTLKISSNLDLICSFVRDQDGFFREEELIDYLRRVGVKTGNLRGQMQVYAKPIFLFYDVHAYMSVESMGINGKWLDQAQNALEQLFVDMGDHVVLRDIHSWWYTKLPSLPGGRPWTALLLQSVLRHYSEALNGAHTIGGLSTQTGDILHAMLVSGESEVQTFADAVAAFLVDDQITQRRFEAEELRQLLVQRGMVAGSELTGNMPRALAKDARFAWDADGRYVTIKV